MPHIFTWFQQTPLVPQVVVQYDFNGNLNDSSPNGNNLTALSTSGLSSAVVKYGTSSFSVPYTTAATGGKANNPISLPGDFTFETWFYLTAFDTNSTGTRTSYVFTTSPSSGTATNAVDVAILPTGTPYIRYVNGVSATTLTPTATGQVALNTWYHIAAVRTGSTAKLYLNGTSIVSGTIGNFGISNVPLVIGCAQFLATNNYRPLRGYVDDFRVCSNAVYTSNFTPPGPF